MNIRFITILLALIFIPVGCTTTSQFGGEPQKEGLQWSIGPNTDPLKWVEGNFQYVKGKYSITELIPKGETMQNWSELMTIQNFANPSGTPEGSFESVKRLREKICPGQTTWNVIAKDEHSILYEWRAKSCAGFPEQHEIARIIDGRWNRFRIAYTAKVSEIPAESRSAWIESMSKATVKLEQN